MGFHKVPPRNICCTKLHIPDTNTVLSGTIRPSFPDMPVGYAFFDKKISPNRMIYYTGSNWVDATGVVV